MFCQVWRAGSWALTLINYILGCQVWTWSRRDTWLPSYRLQTQMPNLFSYKNTGPVAPDLCVSRKSILSVAHVLDATCWGNKLHLHVASNPRLLFYLTTYILLNCLSSALLLFISLDSWKVGNINTIAILQVRKMNSQGWNDWLIIIYPGNEKDYMCIRALDSWSFRQPSTMLKHTLFLYECLPFPCHCFCSLAPYPTMTSYSSL